MCVPSNNKIKVAIYYLSLSTLGITAFSLERILKYWSILNASLKFGSYNLGSRDFDTVAGGGNEACAMGDGEALSNWGYNWHAHMHVIILAVYI